MKKSYNSLEEHYLVPAVLFVMNICVVHLIYAFATSTYSIFPKLSLTISFVLLSASLLFKGKTMLSVSILFYALTVVCLTIRESFRHI